MRRTSLQSEDDLNLHKRGKYHEAVTGIEVNPGHRSSNGISNDPILGSKHKIFLSHSGVQKEFVEHLCDALERCCYHPFYDKRSSSLPRGERFPNLILKVAQQCQMAIVVVSEDYFMSKWPMIELHAFVQALREKSNTNLKILPLFYELFASEFRDEIRRKRWYLQWETWANNDAQGRIEVNEWKAALNVLGSFNGISYNRELKEIVAYEKEIMSHICTSIPPDIKWDDSHVQGKSNICEVICKKIQQIEPLQEHKVHVVGIYGVGGIGKTTTCKTLCNELWSKFKGKVCHVEFDSNNSSSKELVQKVLKDLTSTSLEVLQPLDEDQCKAILRKGSTQNKDTLRKDSTKRKDILHSDNGEDIELCNESERKHFTQRTFLALDNVWDNPGSIKQVKMYLEAPFCEGSLVIVTARSQSTLELLGIDGDACFEVPKLGQADAMNLFLYHAARGKQFSKEEDKRDIERCVNRCYFAKGDGQGSHYHPLALEALGLQLGFLGDKPSEWVMNLPKVRDFSFFPGENPVFDVLRTSFDLLPPTEQSLFMDVVVFNPLRYRPRIPGFSRSDPQVWRDMKEWLCLVYKEGEHEIESRLHRLKRKGLLQDVDFTSGRISMHDLYREFADLEVGGKLDESTDLEKRKWLYANNGDLSELDSTPGGGCWQKLTRVGIEESGYPNYHHPYSNRIESLEGIEWQYCPNVVVLKLYKLPRVQGVLNLVRLKCLRSLEIHDTVGLERLDGLQGLRNLTYFKWSNALANERRIYVDTHVGQFPASLKVLRMEIGLLLGPDVLARCNNLCKLVLHGVEAEAGNLDLSNCPSLQSVTLNKVRKLEALDFSSCSSLQSVELYNVGDLRTLLGLTTRWASRLQSLEVQDCLNLVDIPGLDHLFGLERLVLERCLFKELPDLQNLTNLQVLTLWGPQFSQRKVTHYNNNFQRVEVPGLCVPRQLRELRYQSLDLSGSPNLNGFEQLQVLNLSFVFAWTSLEGLQDLPALRCLKLSGCIDTRLPVLSKWRNLEEFDLRDCDFELHEEDIRMLASLPRLEPARLGSMALLENFLPLSWG